LEHKLTESGVKLAADGSSQHAVMPHAFLVIIVVCLFVFKSVTDGQVLLAIDPAKYQLYL